MLFSIDKDEDDDLFPNPSYKSNLASIFSNNTDFGNSSLTYTAPKQPKVQNKQSASSTSMASSTSSAVLVAKTVQTFKMVDGAYQNQGKLGAVVVTSSVEKDITYQILLYRDKRTHLCIAKINRDFNFHIQPKNYATFYDKFNGIWSILFPSAIDLIDFAEQVALARWKAGDSTTPLMIQDLWCPLSESADQAAAGDSVELTYTLHTIARATEGVEESISVWVEVEDKGWKQTLIGVRPTSKRLVVLQPLMLGDLKPKEKVYNCPVVVKLTVIQVSKAPSKESIPIPRVPTNPPKDESVLQPSASSRTAPSAAAAVESSESPKPTKSDLITRMARMGQALPFKAVAPTPSDSDETEEDLSGRLHTTAPRPRTRLHHAPTAAVGAIGPVVEVASTLPAPAPIMTQQVAMAQPYMIGNMYPVTHMDNQAQFNVFFSEVRTTNSELRMGITRLTDKVEALQCKVDSPEKNQTSREVMSVMERILESEQQLKEQLQTVLSALQKPQVASSSSESVGVPVTSASAAYSMAPSTTVTSKVEPCQKCLQLEMAQERVNKLQEENEYLQTTTEAQKAALQNARLADQDQRREIEEFQKQLSEKDFLIEDLENKNKSLAELQKIVLEKQSCIDKLEQAVKENEDTKLEEVRRNLKEVMDPKPMIGEHVKKILNTVYRTAKGQFQSQTKYDSAFIVTVLAETIRTVTLEHLQNGDMSVSEDKQKSVKVDDCKTTDSGPVYFEPSTADQVESEGGKYVRKDQQNSLPAQAKLSATVSTKPLSETESSATLDTSMPTLHKGDFVPVIHAVSACDVHCSTSCTLERNRSVEAHQIPSEIPASDSFSNVRRPQPPSPPILDDGDNDDDWFNS